MTTILISLLLVFGNAKNELSEVRRLCDVAPTEHTGEYRGETVTVEYLLPDRTRVDVLSPTTAYEADRAHKWAEGIGQAIYYGVMTNRRPAVILLFDPARDKAEWVWRCRVAAARADVKVFVEVVAWDADDS